MCQTWTVLFTAVCGLTTCVPRHYHVVNESKTWSEAQSYCRQTYTDLATISSLEEMTFLTNTLQQGTSSKAFIGLQKGDSRKWQWSLAKEPFFLSSDGYQNWRVGEPNNLGGSEFCGAMFTADGTWFDAECEDQYPFVCFKGKDDFLLFNQSLKWRDAQSYCRQYHTDLATAFDDEVNEKIKGKAQVSISGRIWIGLFNDLWTWSDQSNSSFRYWASDQPNNHDGTQNCAALSVTYNMWNDVTCDVKRNFICYKSNLILISLNLTWAEALRYCREQHEDLVSVHTEEMQGLVMKVAQKASTAHVWLGLRYDYNMDFWYWVSGDSFGYQNWASGNRMGREECSNGKRSGALQSGGEQQWVSLPETERLNFICTTD